MLAMLADSDVDYYDANPDCNIVNCKSILITSSWPEVNEFVFFKQTTIFTILTSRWCFENSNRYIIEYTMLFYYIGYTYFTINNFVKNSKSVSWCTNITMLSMLMS